MSNLSVPVPPLPGFLPGHLRLARGCARDYDALSRFHYVPSRPATFAGVWTIQYDAAKSGRFSTRVDRSIGKPRTVAVAVLSYPTLRCRVRERVLNLTHLSNIERIRFVNANVRTVSRVVVHPQFRSLGLSTFLVRWLCEQCETRYIEALAMMGRAHALFERAGMKRFEPESEDGPIYFLKDRNPSRGTPGEGAIVPHSGQRSGLARRS